MTENDRQTQQPVPATEQKPAPATEQKPAKGGAPDFMKELQDKGFVVLTAQSRDELSAVVNDIPADVHYGAGAVGYNYDKGEYTLRIDLINKK